MISELTVSKQIVQQHINIIFQINFEHLPLFIQSGNPVALVEPDTYQTA